MADQLEKSEARFRSEENLRDAVRRIIIELAPEPKVEAPGSAALVDDLGYHSLALLELAFALEDEFALQPIDEPTARSIKTIDDVLNHVANEFKSTSRIG
jgi:acyl carrier protein